MSRIVSRDEKRRAYFDGVRDALLFHVEHLPPMRKPRPSTVDLRYWQSGFTRTARALAPILQAMA